MKSNKTLVAILMGSDSDLPIMNEAADALKEFGISYEMNILSAHRTPNETARYVSTIHQKGVKVIIAGAGSSAHLPGVCAAYSPLPVIGVPIKSKSLEGLDSLLSIVQMPSGVPVATVAINGAKNAGLLAVQILASANKNLFEKFVSYKGRIAKESIKKNLNLKKKNLPATT